MAYGERGIRFLDVLTGVIDVFSCIFQNAHACNVAEDFVRLLGSSVEPDVRRREIDNFIQYYHDCLVSKLNEKGCFQVPYTVEQIKHAYERLFGQVGIFFAFR